MLDPSEAPKDLTIDKKTMFDMLWNGVLNGKVSTAHYTKMTGRKIYRHGVRQYSKYTGADLREIRHQKARKALDRHYSLGGAGIDESRCLDLISA